MTKFMKGCKFRGLSNSTIDRLRRQGYNEIVWRNGDFIRI